MKKSLYIFFVVSYNIGKHIGKSTNKVEEIAQYVPALSVDDVKKLQKELMQCV